MNKWIQALPALAQLAIVYGRGRLAEPSTWAGIAAVIATGAQAAQTKDPAAIGATVAGIVAIFRPEGTKPAAPGEGAPK